MATAKCRWSLKSCSLADRQKSGPISLLRLPFWLPGVSQAIAPHLESWLAEYDQCDRPIRRHLEEEFHRYLTCRLLCFGFARGSV